MTDRAGAPGRRDMVRTSLIALGLLVVVGGFMLTYLGVGAELGRERQVIVTVRAGDVPRESAGSVHVGDPLYTEPAGMYVGRIVKLDVSPALQATPDASGTLHAAPNPLKRQLVFEVEATGREGEGVTAVGSQVVAIGQRFAVYTPSTFIEGMAIDVRVR